MPEVRTGAESIEGMAPMRSSSAPQGRRRPAGGFRFGAGNYGTAEGVGHHLGPDFAFEQGSAGGHYLFGLGGVGGHHAIDLAESERH